MDIANAQELLWEKLYELEATGQSGYEGFLATVLREITGQPFHVVKSGTQGGSDVRSEPCNLLRVSLEAKQYATKTHLSLDALLYKLTETSTANLPADMWILATTRPIDSSYREKLQAYGDTLGIGVVVWDWPGRTDVLCDLAAVCGSAPEACRTHMSRSSEVGEALEVIRGHKDFESMASHWRRRLVEPDVGYVSGRERCRQWLEDSQRSLADAKSRLGGHHDLQSSRYGVVRRSGVNGELAAWFSDRKAGVAALVGDEGMGKSWAALDWCNELRESLGPESPMIVFLPAKSVKDTDAKSDIADAISKQTGCGSAEFWRRRLDLWESCGREGVRILVVVDGLNQNFLFRDWADWAQPLLEESVRNMYSLLVTCWPNWWRDELLGLGNLEPEPKEIAVEGFNDEELDKLLTPMHVRREDLAKSVVSLMRVPRLSAVALEHREALAKSGDVTAERVVYEDWKDRIRRSGQATGLDDVRMKAFVEELGRELRANVDRAVSRRNIIEILSYQSGRTGEELKVAVAQLTSGGWFRAGDTPDTFKLEPERVPYMLGAALMSELKRNYGSEDVGGTIAEFLDPLKAHSLGARILRAATTIALVEPDTAEELRRDLVARWLDEQNFAAEDFEAFWRLAGLDAELFLEIAERKWLEARTSGFKDEVLIKTLANAADFVKFDEALKAKLIEWLGTAWPIPLASVGGSPADGREPETVHSHLQGWLKSTGSSEFTPVRLREDGEWGWLSHRAVAVMSYLARAPYAAGLEAWALSRALMEWPEHLDDVAWMLRVNSKDPKEADEALSIVVARLAGHSHPTSERAASHLRKAMSHIRRGDRLPEANAPVDCGQGQPVEHDIAKLDGDALFKAVEDCLSPESWKRHDATAGAGLIDALIERGFPAIGREIDLLSNQFREILTTITPNSRSLLRAAFERGRATAVEGDDPQPNLAVRLGFLALLLQLFDASAREQSRLLLASEYAPMEPEWCGICRQPEAKDLEDLSIAAASRVGLLLWLECVGLTLDKALIGSLEFLPSMVIDEDAEIRWRAVEIASHGRHVEALTRFTESEYASPIPDDGKRDFFEERARNRALLEIESIRPGTVPVDRLAKECTALKVRLGDVSNVALDAFGVYLADELKAVTVARTWSTRRYWHSYLDCVKTLVERQGEPVVERLARLMENAAHRTDVALMTDFPVLDTMKALKEKAPEASLSAFHALKNGIKRSIFSKEMIDELPFELSRSKASNAACYERLESAITDKELLDIAYFCHKNGRVDWLLEHIAMLETSDRPANVAKAFTLLGCCDKAAAADTLWDVFDSRPPEDEWLLRVFHASREDYHRNYRARAAMQAFWRNDSDAEARHAWKLMEENCDRRLVLWIWDFKPEIGDELYARQLASNLGLTGVKQAIQQDRDRRKKRLFHTPTPFSNMAPWR